MTEKSKPEYLDDGVYLSDDGYHLTLAVNHHTNVVVYLEPRVFELLVKRGAERFKKMRGGST
jgi:hypothetical protein